MPILIRWILKKAHLKWSFEQVQGRNLMYGPMYDSNLFASSGYEGFAETFPRQIPFFAKNERKGH